MPEEEIITEEAETEKVDIPDETQETEGYPEHPELKNNKPVEIVDFRKYALVATRVQGQIVLLWEWMPLAEARILADKNAGDVI